MAEQIGAITIIIFLISACVYTQVSPEWQTPMGFAIIMLAWVPIGLVVLTLLAFPIVLIPAIFLLGIVMARRAS